MSDPASQLEGESASPAKETTTRRRRPLSRFMMLARRVHLYAGLFLLPWVFLYGITGAMFNHQGLFPEVQSTSIANTIVAGSPMSQFPTPDELAKQVAAAIDDATESVSVKVDADSGAKFTNDLMFEIKTDGQRQVLHINPHSHQSHLVAFPPVDFKPSKLINDVKNIRLDPNPQAIARRSAEHVFSESGLDHGSTLKPHGWTKLNFLATVDDQPARVTYVLKDGHVDVTAYDGSPGMSFRHFFMRLHTSHGQSPSWTARMVWSLFVDTMAFAMFTWGATGLLMWWQIKRVRFVGAIVLACSIAVALTMYFSMQYFYATNML